MTLTYRLPCALLLSFSFFLAACGGGGGSKDSTDANLSALSLSAGTLSLAFDTGTTSYTLNTTLSGDTTSDQIGLTRVTALDNNNFVVISRADDVGAVVDAGSVTIFDGSSGVQVGDTIAGAAPNDLSGTEVIKSANGDYILLAMNNADKGGLVDSGMVQIVAP